MEDAVKKVPLFIAHVNRLDLTERAVESVTCPRVEVTVIDNSPLGQLDHSLRGASVFRPLVPLTFAQSQNAFLRLAGDAPFYLWAHNDMEAVGDTVLRLVAMAEAFTIQKRKWGTIWTAYDALAALSTEAVREVGGWDVNLPQYFADTSIYRKFRLAGYECIDSNLPVNHKPSQTINSDERLKIMNNATFPLYAEYYRKCWGGDPGSELYAHPFNRPDWK